jgi:hypothetical protein
MEDLKNRLKLLENDLKKLENRLKKGLATGTKKDWGASNLTINNSKASG